MGHRNRNRKKPTVPEAPRTPVAQLIIRRIVSTIADILPIAAVFLVARVAVAETYRIPSGSMEPTIQVGDRLVVNKLRFGPHIPFTHVSLPGYAEPGRSDVVVFVSPPQNPEIRITPSDVTPTLVKRIVGVGGDTLLMRDGDLWVNGHLTPQLNTDFSLPEDIASEPQPLFQWQHGIAVHGSRFGSPVSAPSLHQWGPLVVPAGMLFMMGDNRDNSVDSRYYGPVPRENVRGAPAFVYYSYDTESGVEFVRAITEIRWRRIGTWIR